jgi:hypothetical protein
MHMHHIISLYGIFVAIYVSGFLGSISHLTWITEGSTSFVNLRHLMVKHNLKDSILYLVNGLLIAVSFAVFRIWFYHYMIFDVMVHFVLYRAGSFWSIFY